MLFMIITLKNVSDDKIIKASNDAMKIIWDKSAISSMSNETMKSTLESVKAINENPSEYGKLNAVQGAEIRKMLKEIEQIIKVFTIKFWVEIGSLKILKIRNRQNIKILPILIFKLYFFSKIC